MTGDRKPPVVVGVDGSAAAVAAVGFAAGEAVSLGVPLRIVHGYVWPALYACLINVPFRPSDWAPAATAVSMVEAVARRVRSAHPDLAVSTAVATGTGGSVLLDESANASLVVIGSRGSGGIAGLLSGPVVGFLSGRVACPLVVVPEGTAPATPAGQVCVGIDGTAGSLAALDVACGWAMRRGGSVEAVYVATGHPVMGSRRRPGQPRDWVGPIAADFPEVPVRSTVMRGVDPADALLAAGRSARLVVVGAPHHDGLSGSGLGKVVRGVVKRAACPVVIVSARVGDRSEFGADAVAPRGIAA